VNEEDTAVAGAGSDGVLLASVETLCRAVRLVVQDGNKTVQLALPCHVRHPASQRREMDLYASESDTITVYLQQPYNTAPNTLVHDHHPYLIKYQGITHLMLLLVGGFRFFVFFSRRKSHVWYTL